MQPDIVMYSTARQEFMIKLTVSYKTRTEEQHLFKSEKYNDLVTWLRQMAGVKAKGTSSYDLWSCAVALLSKVEFPAHAVGVGRGITSKSLRYWGVAWCKKGWETLATLHLLAIILLNINYHRSKVWKIRVQQWDTNSWIINRL